MSEPPRPAGNDAPEPSGFLSSITSLLWSPSSSPSTVSASGTASGMASPKPARPGAAASMITSSPRSSPAITSPRRGGKKRKQAALARQTRLDQYVADTAESATTPQKRGRRSSLLGALLSPVFTLFSRGDASKKKKDLKADTSSQDANGAATETAPEPEACHADPPNGADHVKMQRVSEPIAEEVEEAEEESTSEDEAVLDHIEFIRRIPPPGEPSREPALPRQTRSAPKMTLVLDLDETLVHCSVDELQECSLTFPVDFNGQIFTVYARIRPHMETFLEEMSKHYEVVLFTASQKLYADKLLNIIDPHRNWVKHRLFREHCVQVQGYYVKDLNILGRNLRKTIIIDNSPHAFAYQLSNGIDIRSWFEDPGDKELLDLIPFLRDLSQQNPEDVRPAVRARFKFHKRFRLPIRD